MRHRKKINHLSRTKEHRNAMLTNLSISLIKHKRVFTTLQKAKALRKYIEPLLTKAKVDDTNSRRQLFRYLQNKESIQILFRDINPKILNRPGGYTRIIRISNRLGDNATLAMIELVDFNEIYHPKSDISAPSSTGTDTSESKPKTRRRSKKPTGTTATKEEAPAVEKKEEPTNQVVEDATPVAEVEEVAEEQNDATESTDNDATESTPEQEEKPTE